MDKDKFKDFIQENKDQFDLAEPSEMSWKNIEQKVYKDKPLLRSSILLRVAASLFLILGAAWMGMQILTISENKVAVEEVKEELEEKSNLAFSGMSDELVEVEQYYVSEVQLKEQELSDFKIDDDLLEEIEVLKLEFDQLKDEMKNSADPMQVVEALINNYQLRLEILQNILDQMKKERMRELQKDNKDESFV